MPSDASIYSNVGANVTPLLNPLDVQAKKIAIQNALAAGTLQNLDIQQRQQQMADERATRNAMLAYYNPSTPVAATPASSVPPAAAPVAGSPQSGGGLPFDAVTGMAEDPTGGAAAPAAAPASPAAGAPAAAPAVPPAPAVPTMSDLIRRGVPPAQASALIGQFQKIDETSSTIQKSRADALKAQKEANDLVSQQASDMANMLVKSAAPGQPINPDLLQWHLQHFASLGPQEAAQAAQIGTQLQRLAPADQIALLTSIAGTPKTIEANAKASDAATAAAKQTQDIADKKRNDFIALGGSVSDQGGWNKLIASDPQLASSLGVPLPFSPAARAALVKAGQSANEQVTTAQTAAYQNSELGVRRGELANEQARTALEQSRFQRQFGAAFGQLSPADQAIAKKLSVGDFNPALLGRMPNKEAIIAGAIEVNPNWTPQAYATKRAFEDPDAQQAKNLATIGRVVGHIGRFETNSKDLGYAPVYGMAGVNLGGTANALSEDSHAIGGELEKLVSGGVGSEGQIQAWQTALRSSIPSVRQKAVDEISQLVGSQYGSMAQAYRTGVGLELPTEKYLTPEAQKWMKSKGINVTTSAPDVAPGAPAPAASAGAPAPADGLQHKSTDELFQMLTKGK